MSLHEQSSDRFRHLAFFYSSWADFVAGTVPFIRAGVEAGEPVLVVESRDKIHMLREALGPDAGEVVFADMSEVGANPARIIPAWQDFVERNSAAPRLRGIGEPIWNGRPPAELVECQRHEALLNAAFDGGRPWSLLCPYDTLQLDPAVVEEARRSHEFLVQEDTVWRSDSFASGSVTRAPIDGPLPQPKEIAGRLVFDLDSIRDVRDLVFRVASASGIRAERAADLVIAANEVATNSVIHGGGGGVLRLWRERDRLVCETRDKGVFADPLADRQRPGADPASPRGLWLANQLCDLVQIRCEGGGTTTVRLHILLAPAKPFSVVGGVPD